VARFTRAAGGCSRPLGNAARRGFHVSRPNLAVPAGVGVSPAGIFGFPARIFAAPARIAKLPPGFWPSRRGFKSSRRDPRFSRRVGNGSRRGFATALNLQPAPVKRVAEIEPQTMQPK
jgi:hypothetical protein